MIAAFVYVIDCCRTLRVITLRDHDNSPRYLAECATILFSRQISR